MSEAKIEFKLGAIEFSGEGEEGWVSQQLDKVLKQAPELLRLAPAYAVEAPVKINGEHKPMAADSTIALQPLATFLKSKGAARNQVKKFLATAVWLEAKGKSQISTADVTSALKDANQVRLGNPSDCLNKNIAKGYCEKDAGQFFVTTEGKDSL